MPLLEVVWIGEACHVYSWGNPDEVNPDGNVCHASSWDMCHVWEGSLHPPQLPPSNLTFLNHLKDVNAWLLALDSWESSHQSSVISYQSNSFTYICLLVHLSCIGQCSLIMDFECYCHRLLGLINNKLM